MAEPLSLEERIQMIQDIIGTDAGNRGMKALIVPGDLYAASHILANTNYDINNTNNSTIVLLSGFPCMIDHTPPTETDGPPGTMALARAAIALGNYQHVVVVTDQCNRAVYAAAMKDDPVLEQIQLETFGNSESEKQDRLQQLITNCDLLVACERAGPAVDGNCYTMRARDMTKAGLIAPAIQQLVEGACFPKDAGKKTKAPFLAIGDGGNELGMGKVIEQIRDKIPDGKTIGCVVAADHLVAASVSNWGGYALAAGAALVRASALSSKKNGDGSDDNAVPSDNEYWVTKCLPTVQDEIDLLNRCVAAGCRDGVSGKMEATVDGMSLETSLQCLRDIREAATKN